jgi:hypothetical protein
MQGKTIYAEQDEIRKVTNNWTAQAEARGTSVSSSTWEVTGNLTLGTEALSGSVATALVTVTGCGLLTNTATLANGEVLELWRKVEAA